MPDGLNFVACCTWRRVRPEKIGGLGNPVGASSFRAARLAEKLFNKESHGNEQRDWQGKVVQQQKGIWFHREGCRRGWVCPLFGHRERRVQDPEGRRQCRIYEYPGSEGISG